MTANPVAVLALDPSTYVSHMLHSDDRIWPETNCYIDLWIETLHALGLDPIAPLAFTLACDFNGEQWEFFKYPHIDLQHLYGLRITEVNLWREADVHIDRHLRAGRLMTIEVDSWFLPDTAGVSYQIAHQKSSIVPQMIDRSNQRLGYFHNRGYYEISGVDYVGALQLVKAAGALPPYAELIDLDALRRPTSNELGVIKEDLARQYVEQRPPSNPVARMAEALQGDVEWLQEAGIDEFHSYAFGTLRQCGAWAELASTFLASLPRADVGPAIDAFANIAATAKTCQFKLARVVAGRSADITSPFTTMVDDWDTAYSTLVGVFGG
jgi:Domain of unknown function (DUF1839)